MKKKQANKIKSKKSLKFVIIGIIILVLIIGGVCTGLSIKKSIDDRSVNIAFYGLSDEYVNLIKENVPQKEKVIINYDIIAPGAMDLSILSKKYDMLFTWKGEVTDSLAGSVEHIPNKILENIPSAMRDKDCIPILLNHYEFNYYKPLADKIQINPSESYETLFSFLDAAKSYVFSPFFTDGGEDRTLFAFIGILVEAKGGLEAYNKLMEGLKTAQSLSDVIDLELTKLADSDESFTLRSLLEDLKTWPVQGLTHPQWYRANETDLTAFARDNQIALFFTSLTNHRTLNYQIVKNFETIRVPYLSDRVEHGVMAPAISCVLVTDNSNGKDILANLLSLEVQNVLAMKSMLAPVHYRAEAYDIQSDDVRFWAASCAGGPIPDPYLAVYQRKPEEFAEMAKEIRAYLK
ncbi:MAG: hypothetical protein K6C97_08670 [Treponema sp.]|nr:hypothetical protein [Treponema sp.]